MCGCYEISDRVISFDTRIKNLNKAKEEISPKALFFNGWVYLSNAAGYSGFTGKSNEIAKYREMARIPSKIKDALFKGKGYTPPTGCVPPPHTLINNKSEIRNKKSKKERVYKSLKTKKEYTLDQVATTILEIFNQEMSTNFKSVKPFLSGIEFWLETYAPDEIEKAIKQLPYNGFWKDKMTPTILFRRKNPRGESVDYIGELINSRRTKWNQ